MARPTAFLRASTMVRTTLAVLSLLLVLAAPAAAQWPTTEWIVLDEATNYDPPEGERELFAFKHIGILGGASRWFESLRFRAPLQRTPDDDLTVGPGETYLAFLKANTAQNSSGHTSNGYMHLTTHPGFLTVDTPVWELMEASAVHELFHAVQKGTAPALNAWMETGLPSWPECPGDSDVDWLVEGTAAAVQIRWLEGQIGGPYGHPFAGSNRAAWVRQFDQPLLHGALPPEHRSDRPEPVMSTTENVSWACDYGTWYFWYAVGEMIARTDAEKVAYMRYLFEQSGPWADGGLANADAGLRAAAAAYDAIRPYRNGFYALYPEFVAQYLTEDRFYGNLEDVLLGAPDLFETTSSISGGPLGPLATRAWRVQVRPPEGVSPLPYNVRFTLDAGEGSDRDALHLIVEEDVAGRPVDPTAPYAVVDRTDITELGADGTIEYLVRVANIAEAAEATDDAEFSLRIEVEGFYGDAPTGGPSSGDVGGELPPGFVVNGPGPWACEGGARSRAFFDLMTPDEVGRDIDRAAPEAAQDLSDMMDNLEITIRSLEQQGVAAGMTSEQIAEIRRQAEADMAAAVAEVQPEMEAEADEMRAEQVTQLLATFIGQAGRGECQMTLAATLTGREGGAQILPGAVDKDLYPEDEAPEFDIAVIPQAILDVLRATFEAAAAGTPGAIPPTSMGIEEPMDGWVACTMTDEERRNARDAAAGSECPAVLCTAGQLVLEHAEQGWIAGSFQFEVGQWPDDTSERWRVPARNIVTGHFNVAATDDGFDDNSLSGMGGGLGVVAGAPILDLDFNDE